VFFPQRSIVFERACGEGIFEAQELRLIWRLTRPGTTYLDIGANIGLMSVPVLATLPEVCVLSVEPSPTNFACLQKTLRSSKYQQRWGVICRAAADQCGPVEFFTSTGCGGALDGLKDTGRSGKAPTKVMVERTTIDRVWEEHRTPEVSCIKIDVEGAELGVLNGAKNCIATQRPSIILECDPEALLHFACEMNFDVVGIMPFSIVSSGAMLRLLMKTCENFLLLPR
jgi:FkbM family methyltransferase